MTSEGAGAREGAACMDRPDEPDDDEVGLRYVTLIPFPYFCLRGSLQESGERGP